MLRVKKCDRSCYGSNTPKLPRNNDCYGVTDQTGKNAQSTVPYVDGNGKIQHAGNVDDAWDKIIADHASRKGIER